MREDVRLAVDEVGLGCDDCLRKKNEEGFGWLVGWVFVGGQKRGEIGGKHTPSGIKYPSIVQPPLGTTRIWYEDMVSTVLRPSMITALR